MGIGLAAYFIFCIGIGAHATYVGLTKRVYDSISPPTALFGGGFSDLFFRFANFVTDSSGVSLFIYDIIVLICLFVVGLVLLKKGRAIKNTIIYGVTYLLLLSVFGLVILFIVPGSVEWGTFWVKAKMDSSSMGQRLSKLTVISDQDQILQKVNESQNLHIYADYTSGSGAVLATVVNDNSAGKLSYYESFYLPIFLANHQIVTGNASIASSKAFFMGDDSLVIDRNIDLESIQKLSLPFAKSILHKAYPKYISTSTSSVKDFELLPDSQFGIMYKKKMTKDLTNDLATNEKSFSINKGIIDSYPQTTADIDAEYKKDVTDQEVRYQNGCVSATLYNDCDSFAQIIAQNKIIIAQDRQAALKYYDSAQTYNKQIVINIQSLHVRIAAMSSTTDTIENSRGEYSVGISIGNDTVYMRFNDGVAIDSDYIRTMVHELLHTYSYSNQGSLPVALDESMTDYLATKSLGFDELDSVRVSGYPLEMQVLLALMEKIPTSDLIDCYFNKDEPKFKKLMAQYFPQVDYKEFTTRFNDLLNGTYHLNGVSRSFDKGLIDHPDVRSIRVFLGLPEIKYVGTIY